MSASDDLIKQIPDENLRKLIDAEFKKLRATKKFGLVFEEQKPEVTPLFDVTIKKNSLVAKKVQPDEVFKVLAIEGENVTCAKYFQPAEIFTFPQKELVSVALFGEPIYPYLQKLDEICNAPNSDLWHILIEADNYHALQLLQYACAERKVDCIYIDPPYNTGARDWKYNNDYVDGADSYRHSKWLSFMQKRLLLAKKILNLRDSVLIVTIDEKEYLHLGCLLEEIFPEAHMQMVSIVINPNGVARDHEMYRVEEYAFFVYFGNAGPAMLEDTFFTSEVAQIKKIGEVAEGNHSRRTVRWERLLRGGTDSDRHRSPGCFYPVYIDPKTRRIVEVGEALKNSQSITEIPDKPGLVTVFPIAEGTRQEKRWRMTPQNLRELVAQGYAKVGEYNKTNDRWSLLYLGKKQRERIEQGQIQIVGRDENNVVIVEESETQEIKKFPKTVWNRQAHSAGEYGSRLLKKILLERNFAFPKSLYAVRDTLKSVVANKKDALIVDFFAGSGTTMHAVNLLNAEDGGKRRCILVTNNEVSDAEEKNLLREGFQPNDEQWQNLGVARYVTWARTVCTITGKNIHGEPLQGNYLGSEIPMADGFNSNAAFFKLGFLNKNAVALGRQFKEILPLLWLKAGSFGKCPTYDAQTPMLILPENKFAVLIEEKYFAAFEAKVLKLPELETIFIVTDSSDGYTAMIQNLRDRKTYQLYRDYLENFTINS